MKKKFVCKRNKFLENILNMKNIEERIYVINGVCISNYEILDAFLKNATTNDLKQVQQLLAKEKYSNKSIDDFVKNAGYNFIKNK